MHTVFVKLNILNILCFKATRQVKVRWAEENILYTVLYTSTLEEEKKQKKRKEKKNENKVWNKKIQSKLSHIAQVHES